MSVFSNRTYNELYIGTRDGQSLIDSNICRSRKRSITWATKDNRIHYFDPRKSIIGTYENDDIIINKRANYYITYKKKNYSIDIYNKNNSEKDDFIMINGENITLEDAIKVIKSVGNNSGGDDIKINKDIVIKKGPYGFYIKYKGKDNVSIPYKLKKKYDNFEKIKSMTLEECEECIEKFNTKKANKKKK